MLILQSKLDISINLHSMFHLLDSVPLAVTFSSISVINHVALNVMNHFCGVYVISIDLFITIKTVVFYMRKCTLIKLGVAI